MFCRLVLKIIFEGSRFRPASTLTTRTILGNLQKQLYNGLEIGGTFTYAYRRSISFYHILLLMGFDPVESIMYLVRHFVPV